jgi:antitoxin VapB
MSIGYPDILFRISGYSETCMPLYIKDDTTARLVAKLSKLRGVSKQDAVKLAVTAELERTTEAIPLRDRFAALRATHPLPPPTGAAADKAFFDDLSGDV